jgi:hypothetical protein
MRLGIWLHSPSSPPLKSTVGQRLGINPERQIAWWISDNLSGWSTRYDPTGTPQGLIVILSLRILVAQALVEPMILLTNHGALQGYGSFVNLS